MLLLITPWMARNWAVAGSPTFSLHSYFLLPAGTLPEAEGDKWDVNVPWVSDFVSPADYARQHPDRVWEKWTRNAKKLLNQYPRLGGIRFLPVVALLGLALPIGRDLRRTAWLLFASFGVGAAFVSLTDIFLARYHHHVLPGLLVVGMGVIWTLLGRLPRRGVRLAGLLLAVVVMVDPGQVRVAAETVEFGVNRTPAADMAFVKAHTRDDAVFMSDVSWEVVWETGRRSVRTTSTVARMDPRSSPSCASTRSSCRSTRCTCGSSTGAHGTRTGTSGTTLTSELSSRNATGFRAEPSSTPAERAGDAWPQPPHRLSLRPVAAPGSVA